MEHSFYELIPTAFGTMGVVWWETTGGPRVGKTFLDRGPRPMEEVIREDYPEAERRSSPAIAWLGTRLRRFLEGEAIVFDLAMVALEACGEFQRKVLLAEYGIPRGWVSTYGRIARHVGAPGAGRAVGTALAQNPFPIIIPCHRAVRADGQIGDYQGGSEMKRALLAMEGWSLRGEKCRCGGCATEAPRRRIEENRDISRAPPPCPRYYQLRSRADSCLLST